AGIACDAISTRKTAVMRAIRAPARKPGAARLPEFAVERVPKLRQTCGCPATLRPTVVHCGYAGARVRRPASRPDSCTRSKSHHAHWAIGRLTYTCGECSNPAELTGLRQHAFRSSVGGDPHAGGHHSPKPQFPV